LTGTRDLFLLQIICTDCVVHLVSYSKGIGRSLSGVKLTTQLHIILKLVMSSLYLYVNKFECSFISRAEYTVCTRTNLPHLKRIFLKLNYIDTTKHKVVKRTFVQALSTGRTARRGSTGIALLYRHWGSVQAVRPTGGVEV
jgi:hypothetical protein